jgi:hypothetical protein
MMRKSQCDDKRCPQGGLQRRHAAPGLKNKFRATDFGRSADLFLIDIVDRFA